MRAAALIPILFFAYQNIAIAQESIKLVAVNPINNYEKDFSKSFDRVLAATNYIDRDDRRYEDAVFETLAQIKVDGCMTARRIKHREECVEKLELVGDSLESYLGL